MSGHARDLGQRILTALALFAAACSSTKPEAKVAPAYYPAPGGAHHASPVRAVPNGDRITWVRSDGEGTAQPAALEPGIESRVHLEANRARRRAGLTALTLRRDLVRLARVHALDMAERGYFSHHSPEGVGPGERAVRSGIRYGAFAENLARLRNAREPAGLAVKGWLDSSGHRRNLLDERRAGYRYTGVGAARSEDGTLYLSQVFLK